MGIKVTFLDGYASERVAEQAAAECVDRFDVASAKNKDAAVASGHLSILEHASFTLRIEGVSRALSHQLVRHRIASYSQKSQRYAKIKTDKSDWFVVPNTIIEKPDVLKNILSL